jgi:signal transduction histidine kinase
MFSGLVLVAGLLLLGITYLLVDSRMPNAVAGSVQFNPGPGQVASTEAVGQPPVSVSQLTVRSTTGEQFNAADLPSVVRESTLRTLLTQGGIALAAVAALAGAFAWLIAGRTLQPLQRITDAARRIGGAAATGRGLHERIALDGPPDEVRQLADTFDAMLERLDRSFEGQRRFVANASHELRTPLAVNRALVEVATTRPDASADTRQLGQALLHVNSRHERLIDGLLTLADSENELTERRPVDLADVAEYVLQVSSPAVAAATADSPGRGITVRDPLLLTAPTAGDPVLLERLVQNLVENAFRHNTPGGWIAVQTETVGQTAVLTVVNTGPLVPGYEVESLFQPFRRLGGERTSERGFGLGLSIVQAVATAHGGSVTATPRDADDGGGLVVRVSLPLERSAMTSPPTAPPNS